MISFIFKALLEETGRVPGFILRHAGEINLASASFLTCVTHLPSSRRGTPVISHWSISLYVLWVTLGYASNHRSKKLHENKTKQKHA